MLKNYADTIANQFPPPIETNLAALPAGTANAAFADAEPIAPPVEGHTLIELAVLLATKYESPV